MIKHKFLYHGSVHRITGEIEPIKCSGDLGCNPEERLKAVYATDRRSLAISYAIIVCQGVDLSGVDDKRKKPPHAIIEAGWPTDLNTDLYVYKVSSKGFKKVSGENHEYYSTKPVKPISIEVVKLKDYIHYAKKSDDWTPRMTKEGIRKMRIQLKQEYEAKIR